MNTPNPNKQFNVYGDTDLSGNLTVLNTTKCMDNLIVDNDIYITGNEQLNGNLDVSGNVDLRGNINVIGTNTIQLDGFVGINKIPNDYSLVVGSNTKTLTHDELGVHKYYTNNSVGLESLSSGNADITASFETGIISGGSIISTSSAVFSDERIKTNFTKPSDNWMRKVEQLKPYEYNLIENDIRINKTLGYKAQDVRAILGNDFIQLTNNVIPNIFKHMDWIDVDNCLAFIKGDINVNIGDRLKIQIVSNDDKLYNENMEIIKINQSYFYIKKPDISIKSLFIYGKYVNDFHTIEINKLNYLNTHCIRELIKENNELKTRITKIEEHILKNIYDHH